LRELVRACQLVRALAEVVAELLEPLLDATSDTDGRGPILGNFGVDGEVARAKRTFEGFKGVVAHLRPEVVPPALPRGCHGSVTARRLEEIDQTLDERANPDGTEPWSVGCTTTRPPFVPSRTTAVP